MKLGTIPLKRWHQEGKLNAPSTDDVLYYGRYLVGSVVSCLPTAYQMQNNIAPTAVAVPLLAVAGCIIHAAYAGQEYLLWAPTIDTPNQNLSSKMSYQLKPMTSLRSKTS